METEGFKAGDVVEIQGLNKGAQYNGRQGEVVDNNLSFGRQDEASQPNERIMVRLFSTDDERSGEDIVLKVLPANIKKISSAPANHSNDADDAFENAITFRAGMKVKIQGLVKAAQYNGEEGVIAGVNETGERFIVSLSGDRTVTVKPENMLSLDNTTKSTRPKPSSSASGNTASSMPDLNVNPDQIRNLSAKDALERATYLKSLDSAGLQRLRMMNPAMKYLSDEEIRAQATQMEMMAKNPDMFEMAKKQMETNPHLMQKAVEQLKSKGSTAASSSIPAPTIPVVSSSSSSSTPAPAPTDIPSLPQMSQEQMRMAQEQMKNADPETIRQQARMFRSMLDNPAQFEQMKRMYPQFASMTIDQLKYQCSMMEMMADNPSMLQSMREQIDNNPDLIQRAMGSQQASSSASSSSSSASSSTASAPPMTMPPNLMSGMTPSADMFDNMSPEQMSDMFKMARDMAKSDPEGFRRMTGMDPSQIEALGEMDPAALQRTMGTMKKVIGYSKPLIKFYQALNNATNGNAKNVILGVLFVLFAMLVQYLFFSSSSSSTTAPASVETNIREELNKVKEAMMNSQGSGSNDDDLEINLD